MSDWHRHNPEFSDAIDVMVGVPVVRPNEAVVDGPDEDPPDMDASKPLQPQQEEN
jgi:hypothetical protein